MADATTITGTCPACFRATALDGEKITRHGWTEHGGRRVGEYGRAWHTGACFGVGYRPFEVSVEGTVAFLMKVAEPDALAAGREVARLETRPRLIFAAPRKNETPKLFDRLPGDAACSEEVAGVLVHVPAYDALLATRQSEAAAWETGAKKLAADLRKKIAEWAPGHLGLRPTHVTHYQYRRGAYCNARLRSGVTADSSAVTCTRCLRAMDADAARKAEHEAVDADARALRDALRTVGAPQTKAQIKALLSWDTKRTNRAIDRGSWSTPRMIKMVWRTNAPEAFTAEEGA